MNQLIKKALKFELFKDQVVGNLIKQSNQII